MVVNELGEIGIDHLLVDIREESLALLPNGCLCCVSRSDLPDALERLDSLQRAAGLEPAGRVLIETSGLADPAPVIQDLLGHPALASRYRLDAVLVTVDALNAEAQARRFPEFSRQLALADRAVLTKTDLLDSAAVRRVRTRLHRFAPALRVIDRRTLPQRSASLQRAGLAAAERRPVDAAAWLGLRGTRAIAHSAGVRSVSLTLESRVSWPQLYDCLHTLLSLHGEQILRLKGVLHIDGRPLPVAVHGIHHQLHAPVELPAKARVPADSSLVFITEGLGAADLQATLAGWGIRASVPPVPTRALQSK